MKRSRLTHFISCLLVVCLLTGCSSSNNLLIPYSETSDSATNHLSASGDETVYSPLFSSDLCVPPLKSDTGNDGNLTAKSLLLVNSTDNRMLYGDSIYEKLYPASITKVMTALLALRYGNLSDMVIVSYEASHITEIGASLCGIKEGDQISLKDLLEMFLLSSGNDAGIAIAEHISGSVEKFAALMNKEALALGATHTHFVNPHGLHDDNHYTTAYDIYLIFKEALKEKEFLKIIGTKKIDVTYKNKANEPVKRTFSTTNLYLKGYEPMPDGITVLGGKTGTTNKAGSCLVLYSKDIKDKEYISVILDADSKADLYSQMSYLLKFVNK